MTNAEFSIRTNIRDVQKTLSAFANKQIPFATTLTLTGLAKKVQGAEVKAMSDIFDRPTPFTLHSVGVTAARKNNLQATVFVKDIAAAYLEPFEFGGNHKLLAGGRTWLNPKNDVPLNQYGNLARNKLKQLQGRSDIFIGKVKTKSGETIDGVWQRPAVRLNQPVRGKSKALPGNMTGRLKLLVRFGDAIPVRQHLGYRERAKKVIEANFNAEFGKALAKAMASAKR